MSSHFLLVAFIHSFIPSFVRWGYVNAYDLGKIAERVTFSKFHSSCIHFHFLYFLHFQHPEKMNESLVIQLNALPSHFPRVPVNRNGNATPITMPCLTMEKGNNHNCNINERREKCT